MHMSGESLLIILLVGIFAGWLAGVRVEAVTTLPFGSTTKRSRTGKA
jgi:hypothetical protein